MKALFPKVPGPDLQAVLINTAGGITGGDHFSLLATAGDDCNLTLTTQAAERAYCAQPDQLGKLQNKVSVGKNARVNWLPQETILYQGCALRRQLQVNMTEGSSLLLVEPLVFGRLAMGEVLTNAQFQDRIEIYRDGRLAYLDAVAFYGDISAELARPHIAAGNGAMANLVFVDQNAQAHIEPLRAMLGESGGVSLVRDDMLCLRLLAPDSYLLRQTLIPILNLLTDDNLPRCWMIKNEPDSTRKRQTVNCVGR